MALVARKILSPGRLESLHSIRQRALSWFVSEPYATALRYSMVGLPRLKNLVRLVRTLDNDDIAGDVVECGTCNGGSGALLAHAAQAGVVSRHTWLLDSFEGLPPATAKDGAEAREWTGFCRGSTSRVRRALRELEVDERAVTLVPGWFSETLGTLTVDRIALLHIDADWYESVLEVLDALFDRVPPGGFIVFDDYDYWAGCRAAWQDFRSKRRLKWGDPVDVDGTGAYLRVP